MRRLPFREFEFHGYTDSRRMVSFGWYYDFLARHLRKADDIPDFLLALRRTAATFSDLDPGALRRMLVMEYSPVAEIGWHRNEVVDKNDATRRAARLLRPQRFRWSGRPVAES